MKDKFEILFKKQEIDTKDKFMAGKININIGI